MLEADDVVTARSDAVARAITHYFTLYSHTPDARSRHTTEDRNHSVDDSEAENRAQ